ncbi:MULTISPECIES: DUF305 domain-containing protein [unclassified Gordonia (in: high G+C Gram-positive bacteria)]|uniref:DUF305 domain-containing protein n=1 Tax=unclassified Gordonia (in: high G+C Gram-positive bacteria) TaxID=2657482 RepID=UPI00080DA761|nr:MULTISPECIES: DUF305 domain-containing protein [unclassified Gordonia (in: high G+C Gram-positive bacteria)]OCH78862.1 DUF305 domain-containing protein [Gordonia sp. UCD-TK1]OCW88048.1 DUF305 domain-containing protein [Nocardia farcinica]UCZ90116.1 DUF305 domain-containing protein [Gordonia sp. WA4-43]WGJ87252.1 DUF305 domain-containing protein [Gordonia sp. SMJS1]
MTDNSDQPESRDETTTPEGPDDTAEPSSRPRILLALGGAALLLFGLGLGLLIQASLADDSTGDDSPAANSAAVGFAQDMTRHHEQGVELAAIELEHGTDPEVRSMAFDILTAQSNEIGQMQSWLTRWGQPVTNPGATMAWMGHGGSETDGHDHSDPADHSAGGHDHGHGGDGSSDHGYMDHGDMDHGDMSAPASGAADSDAEQPPMPGMATSAEMQQFRAMRGPEVDIRFLQLMLRHHEGGLHMMEYAADPANVEQAYVRDLASSMKRTQDKEIAIITQMLALRGAQPLPLN